MCVAMKQSTPTYCCWAPKYSTKFFISENPSRNLSQKILHDIFDKVELLEIYGGDRSFRKIRAVLFYEYYFLKN